MHQTSKSNFKIIRNMSYRDFSGALATNFKDFLSQEELRSIADRAAAAAYQSNKKAFPLQLFTMLASLEDLGLSRICSWNIHGRSFKIHDPEIFEIFILPMFFRSIKMRSFKKNLNSYGFRSTRGCGAYYQELFLKGKPFLCTAITRRKPKSATTNVEPDFYAMPYLSSMLPGHYYEMSVEVFGDDKKMHRFIKSVQAYEQLVDRRSRTDIGLVPTVHQPVYGENERAELYQYDDWKRKLNEEDPRLSQTIDVISPIPFAEMNGSAPLPFIDYTKSLDLLPPIPIQEINGTVPQLPFIYSNKIPRFYISDDSFRRNQNESNCVIATHLSSK